MKRRGANEGSIRQRPNGTWEARYRASHGRPRSLYARTRREAVERLRAALTEREQGIRPPSQRLTVSAFLADWLEHSVRPRCRPATVASYETMVRLYLDPELGRLPLAKLGPEHVQAMPARLSGPNRSPTTVRYVYSVLRIALGRAAKQGKVIRNVATVFTTAKGTPLDTRNVTRYFQLALQRAGLPHQRFHDLRHAAATVLIEQGVDLSVVSRMLGHADLATTADVYAHLTDRMLQTAADRMDAALSSA